LAATIAVEGEGTLAWLDWGLFWSTAG